MSSGENQKGENGFPKWLGRTVGVVLILLALAVLAAAFLSDGGATSATDRNVKQETRQGTSGTKSFNF